jgi:2-dehydro-3-deoxyphosphogalactonate aldolase
VAAERAVHYVNQGFTAIKFDPIGAYSAFDPRQLSLETMDNAEEIVKQVREAVGGEADLLIGTHGQMTTSSAIRFARRLEKYDPLWFEEPVPPENVDELARVADSTKIPVATGERLATKYEFARILEKGAASILQMALGRSGGILEGKKIAGMAEAHYAQIAPHLYCGPIEGAANIQLGACSPNFLIQEGIETWGGFHAEILDEPLQWQDGYIIPPTGPGLGVELDEAVAASHPYTGDELHLEMTDRPL